MSRGLHNNQPASPQGSFTPRWQRRAFTLIELLVVISIVALLIALLMPALRNARNAAQDIRCAAQMKQIYVAIMSYALDDKGRLPNHLGYTTSGAKYQFRKNASNFWAIKSNVNETQGRQYIGAGKILQHHLTQFSILYCPTQANTTGGGTLNLNSNSIPGNSTIKGFGYWRLPVSSQAGNYYTNYLYPTIDVDVTTRTNSGGTWVDNTPPYWSTTGTFNSYTNWKNSMLKSRPEENQPGMPILWDCQSMGSIAHGLRTTNVIYVDGGHRSYGATRMVQEKSTGANGVVGLSDINGSTWLRRYRTEGYLPY